MICSLQTGYKGNYHNHWRFHFAAKIWVDFKNILEHHSKSRLLLSFLFFFMDYGNNSRAYCSCPKVVLQSLFKEKGRVVVSHYYLEYLVREKHKILMSSKLSSHEI